MGGYALSGLLTFFNVWVTARLMFASQHDLLLATVLLVFATGIAMSLGFFLSAALTGAIAGAGSGSPRHCRRATCRHARRGRWAG